VIDESLVRRLVAAQFPQWSQLPIRPVQLSGWDNRTFHLGQDMVVRLPTGAEYAAQVEKEQKWLPKLAQSLPLPIPMPLARGLPAFGFPWNWSIYRWIEGDVAVIDRISDPCEFAISLGRFLVNLRQIDTTGGPEAGAHNFFRGGALSTYDNQVRQAIEILSNSLESATATQVWESAIATGWKAAPVWIHGDIAAGNLLMREGKLSAVIDFGMLGIGDPACDLAIAWTFFRGDSRTEFREAVLLDKKTWARGRAWALWKALIVSTGLSDSNEIEAAQCRMTLIEVLRDFSNELSEPSQLS
jgi:aminoglycoside phosphotransferase (APT) family kinase protein